MEVNLPYATRIVGDISGNHLLRCFVQLSVVAKIMEHKLTFRVSSTLVIQLFFLHANLAIYLVFLKIGSQRSLPLMLLAIGWHNILILVLHSLLVIV